MNNHDIYKLQNQLKKVLEPKRYEHTLGVSYTAVCLSYIFGVEDNEAILAGLLHDCAKCLSHAKRISICKKHHIEITEVEEKNPVLLHAKVGAYLAKEKYNVADEDILNAILYHTTGKPDMTLLEKIIYVSDYIEPHRKKLPRLEEIRKIAFKDLDMAVYMILENSVSYLEKGNAVIDLKTMETYEYYKDLIEKRGNV